MPLIGGIIPWEETAASGKVVGSFLDWMAAATSRIWMKWEKTPIVRTSIALIIFFSKSKSFRKNLVKFSSLHHSGNLC